MYEYKVIPAPARAEKQRGLKTTAERFAHSLAQAINAEAEEGWEYVRAEQLPCEERKGLMGGVRRSTETVLIFRRALAWVEASDPATEAEAEPAHADRREPLFRPDALSRAAAARRQEPRLRARDADR
jgi:hypothetical protein